MFRAVIVSGIVLVTVFLTMFAVIKHYERIITDLRAETLHLMDVNAELEALNHELSKAVLR